jgi:D-glycero-D-manno-heptose 1,7-bisphosphate phosphatase
MTNQRALFLDRDGVINLDCGYVHERARFNFVDGIFDLVKYANSLYYAVFVVTNQAGIGRGFYTEFDFEFLTNWMCDQFLAKGSRIEKVYYCPDHPEYGLDANKRESFFRKPGPGMILAAAQDYNLDLRSSVLIGDKVTDIEAGIAAGVGCNILYHPQRVWSGVVQSYFVVETLQQAQQYL